MLTRTQPGAPYDKGYSKILLENKLLLLYEVGDLKNFKPHYVSMPKDHIF